MWLRKRSTTSPTIRKRSSACVWLPFQRWGALCRKDAAELLFKLALRTGAQQLPYDRPLGLAALAALGKIKPPDTGRRLAPLLTSDKRMPRLVRIIAKDVIAQPGSCR